MRRAASHFLKYICLGIISGFILLANPAHTQQEQRSDAGYIFYRANTLYEKGSYDEAISEYSRLLELGLESGSLHYNLGNSYFKKGELGKALLSYERAKRLVPRDSDLKSNYAFAKSRIRANISEMPDSWADRASGIFSFLSLNELTVLLSFLFTLTMLILAARLFFPLSRNSLVSAVACIVILSAFTAFSLANRVAVIDREAIVVADDAEARFEPFESSTAHFTLYEGMKIYLVQSRKEWAKIRRSDGKTGWVKTQAIEKIDLPRGKTTGNLM